MQAQPWGAEFCPVKGSRKRGSTLKEEELFYVFYCYVRWRKKESLFCGEALA